MHQNHERKKYKVKDCFFFYRKKVVPQLLKLKYSSEKGDYSYRFKKVTFIHLQVIRQFLKNLCNPNYLHNYHIF